MTLTVMHRASIPLRGGSVAALGGLDGPLPANRISSSGRTALNLGARGNVRGFCLVATLPATGGDAAKSQAVVGP